MKFSISIFVLVTLFTGCDGPPAPLPTADFFVDGSEGTAPCKVLFYDHSLNALSWEWDFGNGTSSVNQNDSSIYISPGVYTIELGVWNEDNIKDSISKTVTIY